MKNILKKKGQLRIGDAPGVVLIILFLFMILGTAAFILAEYQKSFPDLDGRVDNETLTTITNTTGVPVAKHGACNFGDFAVLHLENKTDGQDEATYNYTVLSNGMIIAGLGANFTDTDMNVTYTYTYSGTACNITSELTGEVEDNVSIAGMVLTISLIGIVLSILIGLFAVFTQRRGL